MKGKTHESGSVPKWSFESPGVRPLLLKGFQSEKSGSFPYGQTRVFLELPRQPSGEGPERTTSADGRIRPVAKMDTNDTNNDNHGLHGCHGWDVRASLARRSPATAGRRRGILQTISPSRSPHNISPGDRYRGTLEPPTPVMDGHGNGPPRQTIKNQQLESSKKTK